MALSISKTGKKIGRPATDATPIMVRVHPTQLAALDAYIATLDPQPSRPEAIRYILQDWLTGTGFLPHREDPEGAN